MHHHRPGSLSKRGHKMHPVVARLPDQAYQMVVTSRRGYELTSCPCEVAEEDPGSVKFIVWGPRVCSNFPGQVRTQFLLCSLGKPQAVLSVQGPPRDGCRVVL